MSPVFHGFRVAVLALVVSALGACAEDGDPTDTIAPTISATAKVGADAVLLSAVVNDNVAVMEVEFVIDDGTARATVIASHAERELSTSIPRRSFRAGRHKVVATAIDAAGNATVADAVSFEIGGAADPASPIHITATSAVDGANVTFTVDIESEAQIRLSNFFLDGVFLGGRGDDQRHYVLARVLSSGTHRLVVDVTDVNGKSSTVEVVVEV